MVHDILLAVDRYYVVGCVWFEMRDKGLFDLALDELSWMIDVLCIF